MKAITGIAGCCARAESGHAAAPPRSVINSRRLTLSKCILSLSQSRSRSKFRPAGFPNGDRYAATFRLGLRPLGPFAPEPSRGAGRLGPEYQSAGVSCVLERLWRSKRPLYSSTSSAAATNGRGTWRPSALAVLRLITSSNFAGSCTGQVARFLATQHAIDVSRGAAERLDRVSTIGHQAARFDEHSMGIERRNAVAHRESNDQFAVIFREGIARHEQGAVRLACERLDRRFQIERGAKCRPDRRD